MLAINPKIKQKAEDIRKKIFGAEVRESLASGIEAISEDVEATIGRQDYVEEQFQDVLDETTGKDVISAPELIAARNGEANLKTRLDKEKQEVTAQLQQIANKKVSSIKARPLFTIMDDDGHEEVYTVLKGYLTSRNIRGNVAQPSDYFKDKGHSDRITVDQLKELQDVHGWEVLSHGVTQVQLNDLTPQQAREQLGESKKELERLGFNVNHYCYGYGYPQPWVQELVKEYYLSGVNAQAEANNGRGVNTVPIMQYNVSRIPFGAYSVWTLAEAKAMVDWTLANNGWMILQTHISVTPEDKRAELQELLTYIQQQNGQFATYSEGFNVFGNDTNKGIYTKDLEEDIYLIETKTGEIYENKIGAVDVNTPPDHFPFGTIQKSFFSNYESGFPSQEYDGGSSQGGGTLINYHSPKDVTLSYQIFIPPFVEKMDVLVRRALPNNTWDMFHSLNASTITPKQYSASLLCKDFPSDKITTYTVLTANATGYPHNRPGMVTTYNVSRSERGFGKQIFYSHNGIETFIRYEGVNGTWSDWYQLGLTVLV